MPAVPPARRRLSHLAVPRENGARKGMRINKISAGKPDKAYMFVFGGNPSFFFRRILARQ
jgi:hypothetical protein